MKNNNILFINKKFSTLEEAAWYKEMDQIPITDDMWPMIYELLRPSTEAFDRMLKSAAEYAEAMGNSSSVELPTSLPPEIKTLGAFYRWMNENSRRIDALCESTAMLKEHTDRLRDQQEENLLKAESINAVFRDSAKKVEELWREFAQYKKDFEERIQHAFGESSELA